jgi:hypothetical protein
LGKLCRKEAAYAAAFADFALERRAACPYQTQVELPRYATASPSRSRRKIIRPIRR